MRRWSSDLKKNKKKNIEKWKITFTDIPHCLQAEKRTAGKHDEKQRDAFHGIESLLSRFSQATRLTPAGRFSRAPATQFYGQRNNKNDNRLFLGKAH